MAPMDPMEAFPTWAHFSGVRFTGVKLQHVGHGRGLGLVAVAGSDVHGSTVEQTPAVLRVPHELVLSAEAVENYAKIDHNFQHLRHVAGRKSTRGDILLYLVSHLAQGRSPAGLTPTPWTKYISFLPGSVPVPTTWSGAERELLNGTSLEAALKAKLAALQDEFQLLQGLTEGLPFWNTLLWARPTIRFEDWLLVDAWFRSRCLELPGAGTAMVPALDMVNHSSEPSSFYEVDGKEDVLLLVRPETSVSPGREMTISYGAAKSASEMLFSYGFVDPTESVSKMILHLGPFPDDPLAAAKVHIFNGPRILELSLKAGHEARENEGALDLFSWHSPFVHLMCLNEEDGLSFQLLQDTEGGRSLRLFWQDEDVTERADELEALIKDHRLCQVFRLRAVTVVLQTVEEQMCSIRSGPSDAELESLQSAGAVRSDCLAAAELLKAVEGELLARALEALRHERDALLADDDVVAYLESVEGPAMGEATSGDVVDEDEADFS
ncbi:hypothetical protein E4U41_005828 [Claviceps citrina]|nr:hypothetical protein E4U41_005828 [Claviceps citrina]